MRLRHFDLIFKVTLGLLVFQSAFAEEKCATSPSELMAQEKYFPDVIQPLPTMLIIDSIFVTAGIKIGVSGGKLKLEGHVWKLGSIYIDDAYLKKVCYDGETIKVTLENGKTYDVKAKSSTTVSIQGATFKRSSDSEFAGIIQKIRKAQSETTVKASNENSVR